MEPFIEQIRADEKEGFYDLGDFNLYERSGLHFPDTVIQFDEFTIASDKAGWIYIFSQVHNVHHIL